MSNTSAINLRTSLRRLGSVLILCLTLNLGLLPGSAYAATAKTSAQTTTVKKTSVSTADKKAVHSAAVSFYKAIAAGNRKNASRLCENSVFFSSPRTGSAFWTALKKYNKRMTFKVSAVRITGSTAQVSVKVRFPNLKYTHLFALDDLAALLRKAPNASVAARYAAFFRSYLTPVEWIRYPKTTAVLSLRKTKGIWKISGLDAAAQNSVTGNLFTALDDWDLDLREQDKE